MCPVCEVAAVEDRLVFSGPELETVMAYLTVRNVAEKVEVRDGALHITPQLPELANALKALCNSDVSSLLLDVKESLLHMGWLVEGGKDVVKIRRSRRAGVSGFITFEYDKLSRTASVLTTQLCLSGELQRLGFEVFASKYLLEARRHVNSLVEAIELEEALSKLTC